MGDLQDPKMEVQVLYHLFGHILPGYSHWCRYVIRIDVVTVKVVVRKQGDRSSGDTKDLLGSYY